MKTYPKANPMTLLLTIRTGKRWLLFCAAGMALSACASSGTAPIVEINAAERAIENADRAQVIRYTSVELNAARTELAAARSAVLSKNMLQARQLAEQAQLSAELGLARAELLKATAVNQDMQQSIIDLQQETQRNLSGVKP